MDEQRMKGLMGLCARAGMAVFGEEGCRRAIAAGQCGILLVDGGISPGSRKRYEELCRKNGTPTAFLPEGMLEEATGKPGVAMCIRRGSFSDQIILLAHEEKQSPSPAEDRKVPQGKRQMRKQNHNADMAGGTDVEWQR